MRLLVDGVAFQLAQEGDDEAPGCWSRRWTPLLEKLAAYEGVDLVVLDRGGVPDIYHARRVPFPSYVDRYTADDSSLLDAMCVAQATDAFLSTGFTTPLSTPALLVCFGPERPSDERRRKERDLAFTFARRIILAFPQEQRAGLDQLPGFAERAVELPTGAADLSGLVSTLHHEAANLVEEVTAGHHQVFFQRWAYLRRLQAKVDLDTFSR